MSQPQPYRSCGYCNAGGRERSVVGSYHQISAKHLPAYLDEFEWRFDNRKNPYLFRDTILRLVDADRLEYKELTRKANS